MTYKNKNWFILEKNIEKWKKILDKMMGGGGVKYQYILKLCHKYNFKIFRRKMRRLVLMKQKNFKMRTFKEKVSEKLITWFKVEENY